MSGLFLFLLYHYPHALAVPSIIFIAASTSLALRSSIFLSAISFEFGSSYLPRFARRSFSGTFFHAGGLSHQVRSRRGFHFERKCSVFVDAYFHGNNVRPLFSGSLVELADEFADIDSRVGRAPDRSEEPVWLCRPESVILPLFLFSLPY